MRRTLLLVVFVLGCGGRYRSPQPAGGGTPATADAEAPPPIPVEQAALPYAFVDARTGRAVAAEDVYAALGGARAVCVGEDHPNPHHHWAQLTVVSELATRSEGARMALGLEMVQQPFQGVLDDWSGGAIDEAALLSRTGWADRWGYDFAMYRPILERARASAISIVALNAPRELVKAVARKGVGGLAPDEKARLPAMVLDDTQHRAWFDKIMSEVEGHDDGHGGGHGGGGPHAPPAPSPDNVYAAQVVWDESMAERAHAWLASSGGSIIILAGNGHCHDSAIVRRLTRRGGAPAVSIRPIVDDGEGNVARALLEAHNDYLFVMTPAPR